MSNKALLIDENINDHDNQNEEYQKNNSFDSSFFKILVIIYMSLILFSQIGIFTGFAYRNDYMDVCNIYNINFPNNTMPDPCDINTIYIPFILCTICTILSVIICYIHTKYGEKNGKFFLKKNKCIFFLMVHIFVILLAISNFVLTIIFDMSKNISNLPNNLHIVYKIMNISKYANFMFVYLLCIYYAFKLYKLP